jgi:hypothetical protein
MLTIQHVLSFIEPTTPAPAEFTPLEEVVARGVAKRAVEYLGERAPDALRPLLATDGQPTQALTDIVRTTCKKIAPGYAIAKDPDGAPSRLRYHGQADSTTRADLLEAWICAHAAHIAMPFEERFKRPPMTAKECFETIAQHAAKVLTPPARGAAVAASLRQIGELAADLPLDLIDAGTGFYVLSQTREEDAGDNSERIAARRKTCGELAGIAQSYDPSGGDILRLAAVFDRVVERFTGSADPRQDAMAWTAAREATELRGRAAS